MLPSAGGKTRRAVRGTQAVLGETITCAPARSSFNCSAFEPKELAIFVSVVGASGAIGKSTVSVLSKAGHRVRVVGRSAVKLESAFGAEANVERRAADVTTRQGCADAAEGVDALVFTPGLANTAEAAREYPALTRQMVEACSAANVRALVLISNTYPFGIPENQRVTEESPLRPVGVKGSARAEQESIVLGAHAPEGLRTAVLRLPLFFGPRADNSVLAMAAAGVAHGRPAMLLAPVDVRLEWVVTSDVGPVILRLLDGSALGGEVFNMGGSGLASQRELVELMMEAAGRKVPQRILPSWTQRLLSLFVPALRDMRDVKYLTETPIILDETKLSQALGGPIHHTPLREAARAWIELLTSSPGAAGPSAR